MVKHKLLAVALLATGCASTHRGSEAQGLAVSTESLAMIDPSLFPGSGPDVRRFSCTEMIAASRSVLFRAFSDEAEFERLYARGTPAKARIDLAIGGAYEWLFDGEIGSNDCQVLAYIPNEMLAFSWNAPVEQDKSRRQRTWVVVEFDEIEHGSTQVTLTHLGFGTERHWDETYEYFQNAWPFVLRRMKDMIESST